MDAAAVRKYRDRWQAVAEIEQRELRAMTAEDHWRQLNSLVRFARETGLDVSTDDPEIDVWQRWARLKDAR